MLITYKNKDEEGTETYLLSENDETIGFIKINLALQMIMDIFVKEELRKKGYGTQLVKHAEKLFVEKGILEISTTQINNESYGFFDKLGYSLTGSKTLN